MGEAYGHKVKLAEGTFARDDYVAGTPEQRAADLNCSTACGRVASGS